MIIRVFFYDVSLSLIKAINTRLFRDKKKKNRMITSLDLITVVERNRCSIITLFLLPILLLLKVINFLMSEYPLSVLLPALSVIINLTHQTNLGGK